jgi:NAD(P)-dependent dehydrogenase (short-subunit alcohol dehydrogenase family)
VARFGRLDAIVNNAMHDLTGPVIDIPIEVWRDAFRINTDALLVSTQAAFRLMPNTGGGAVVNISSTCGMKALGGMASYSASKAAGQHFAAVAAMEGARYGVRVNTIVPGFVRTPAVTGFANGDESILKAIDDGNPMGRMGEPVELANAILFLCSDEASYINGVALPVDGGHLMRIHTPG